MRAALCRGDGGEKKKGEQKKPINDGPITHTHTNNTPAQATPHAIPHPTTLRTLVGRNPWIWCRSSFRPASYTLA